MNNQNNDNEKIALLLKFLNCILSNLNKPNIDNLFDFKKITRKDIISQANVLHEMTEEFNNLFTKKEVAYSERNRSKYYILVFLKSIVKSINLKLTTSEKIETVIVNDKKYNRAILCYSIIQK